MSKKLKTIIIEDEILSSEYLHKIVEEYCPSLEVVGSASSIEDGLSVLQNTVCDIVFLDIELDGGNSFQILEQLKEPKFSIIFTTAYDHFAFKAFQVEAVDYLLKPYSPKDVIQAIEKVKRARSNQSWIEMQQVFIENKNPSTDRISLHTAEGVHIVDKNDIIHCEADGSYCLIHIQKEGSLLISRSLSHIESMLDGADFFRVHTGHLVNINHIKKYLKEDGGYILMDDGSKIPVSRRKKQEFLDLIRFEQ